MADASQKIPVFEKIGYSAADAAANFVFLTMVLFQANFYTDVMHLTATEAASIVLIARLWDAVFDPLMGIAADRTRTRWGSFRPWILWSALPWGIIMYLAYTTPFGWSGWPLYLYALITNILLMTTYSANNMPYAALGGVMTGDVEERSKLNSYRFVAVNIAQFIVGGFTLVWVAKFAGQPSASMPQGDQAHGWQKIMGIYAIICVVCFLITFLTARERLKATGQQKGAGGSTIKQDFADLLKNGPWIVMFIMTFIHFVILPLRGSAAYNYYHKYADRQALYRTIEPLGLTAKLPMFSSAAVDPAANTVDLKGAPGLSTGMKVEYWHGYDAEEAAALKAAETAKKAKLPEPPKFVPVDVGGLVNKASYFVNVKDGKVKLYDTKEHAIDGGTAGMAKLSKVSTGTQHELVPQTLAEYLGFIVHGDPKQDLEHSTVADVAFGLQSDLNIIVLIAGIIVAPSLAKKFGKKAICVTGTALMTINSFAFYFVPEDCVWGMILITVTYAVSYGPIIPLLWAIFADVVDYNEWKTGRRATGIVFATIGFALKAGLALGTAMFLWIMAANNYDADPNSKDVVHAVQMSFTIYTGILFGLCTILLAFLQLNKRVTNQMADELAARRKAAAPAPAA
jgi:Na+/melibiose symporter-like transporter